MEKIKELYFKYKEVINYLFFGGCTTLVSIVVFYFFNKTLGLNEHFANVISWIFAVLFAYVTNRKYVFESHTTNIKELIKEILSFFSARLLTLGLEEIVLFVGANLLSFDPMIVKVVGQVIVVISNYFLSKLFVFKK